MTSNCITQIRTMSSFVFRKLRSSNTHACYSRLDYSTIEGDTEEAREDVVLYMNNDMTTTDIVSSVSNFPEHRRHRRNALSEDRIRKDINRLRVILTYNVISEYNLI